jgi:hypothetical protein
MNTGSHFYPSTLIFYTRQRVNIMIYRTVYLHACVNVNAYAINIKHENILNMRTIIYVTEMRKNLIKNLFC